MGLGSIIGGAAGGGAGGTMATAAKFTGAAAVGRQIAGAGKNLSWILLVLGIFHYVFRIISGGNYGVAFVLSLGLFVFAGYALSQRMGQESDDRWAMLFPMLAFVVWYFWFNANYDPIFLSYYLGISFGTMVLIGAVTKGKAIKAELIGFLPVLFLFLDIGLVPFLVEKLHLQITPFVEGLVLYMPWWAFFGLLTLPSDATKNGSVNFLVNLTKILGILYLIFVIVSPTIPDVGHVQSSLPQAAEFEDAQARLREKIGDKENPAVSNWKCLFAGRFTDLQECIAERQLNSDLRAICLGEGFEEGTSSYKKCIEEQNKIREQGAPVTGINDPTITEPTTAKFVVGQYFPDEITHDTGRDIEYPVNLEITNPRKQNLSIEVSCNFTNKKNKKESFVGDIVSEQILEFSEEKPKTTVICRSPKDKALNGSYNLVYSAELRKLKSASKLQRAFIGDRDEKWKKEWVPKIMSAHFSSRSHLSQGAPDLARINFGYGNTVEDPIVEPKYGQTLSASIENIGNGKVKNIESINFDGLEGFGDLQGCVTSMIPKIPAASSSAIPLKTCFTKIMPSELANPPVYTLKEFEATITYDYLIERTVGVTLKLIE